MIVKLPTLLEISNYLFTAGLVGGTLSRVPILSPFLAPILGLPVAIVYIVGYALWYVGSLFHEQDLLRNKDRWYGFTKTKHQHQISALLGMIAAILGIALPTLLAPVAWLFVISNLFWTTGAFHIKEIHLNNTPNHSSAKQKFYAYFTVGVTALSVISALSLSISALFPLAAPVITPIATALGVPISLVTFGLLTFYQFGRHKPDKVESKQSTHSIKQHDKLQKTPSSEPQLFKSPIAHPQPPAQDASSTLHPPCKTPRPCCG